MRRLPRAFLLALTLSFCKEPVLVLQGDFSTFEKAAPLIREKSVSGRLVPGVPVFFRISISQPSMLRAELGAVRGMDTALELIDSGRHRIVATDDYGSSLAEEIFPVYVPAGDYFLKVSGAGGENGTFTFFYRVFNPPADVEREPNNDLTSANAIGADHAVGFYGPQYFAANGQKQSERDCFFREIPGEDKRALALRLTGVDGIAAVVTIYDTAGKELIMGEGAAGAELNAGPVAIAGPGKIYICVAAKKIPEKASKDYYELKLTLAEISQRAELEPNNDEKNANSVAGNSVEGAISTHGDVDFFRRKNPQEYPVYLRVELIPANQQVLKLIADRGANGRLVFEDSAPGKEIAENLRVEPGEEIILSVRVRDRVVAKKFQSQAYTLKFQESGHNDEAENEPNDTPEKADVLVDLTQKWGFINPPGDTDYYRLQLGEEAERTVLVESKLGCKAKIEHFREGKSVASRTAADTLSYRARLRKNDLLKLNCLGQKKNPPERAYRIALSE